MKSNLWTSKTKKYFESEKYAFQLITLGVVFWRLALFVVSFFSVRILPVFGARFPYFDRVLEITKLPPWIWGFGNFDGVHYLRIAQDGYQALATQAFFPIFPLLIRFVAKFFTKDPTLNTNLYVDPAFFFSAMLISNLVFVFAVFIFYKLLRIDFSHKTSINSVLLLLVFPTSYYFGAIYTESLFLFLAVTSIFLIRTKRYFLASIFIALGSATRIIGILLLFIYLIELIRSRKSKIGSSLGLIIAPLGLAVYMYFLQKNYSDPMYFLTAQPIFGADRSSKLILLPQVFFRYLKIFLTVDYQSFAFFNAALEFIFTIAPLMALVLFWKKMRLSYWVFTLGVLVLPTLTGTFSSMRFIFLKNT